MADPRPSLENVWCALGQGCNSTGRPNTDSHYNSYGKDEQSRQYTTLGKWHSLNDQPH